MGNDLRFDGRVAIITGAGNGLGRAHALLLGARGARVVVNDLGGGRHGEGKSSEAADRVVAEIKAAGGEAVANYDSVEDGEKIVQCALDSFGQLDIVVNNAGILRDTSFIKMSAQDWELIYRVHVLGAFKVTHAAWAHMRDREYGRILMTSSAAGIYGNFGQANYAMAKLGLVGFASTLALEGKKKNVLVNTIAPLAGSRLTETVLPKDLTDALRPELVSPLVAYLCHESCSETGGLFEVGGGLVSKLRWERTVGHSFKLSRPLTPEAVAKEWPAITDFGKSTHPADITASMEPVLANLPTARSRGGNEFIDVDEALAFQYPESKSSYSEKELSLYALGIGAAQDALDDAELRTVFEQHSGGFRAIPTFGVIPALETIFKAGQVPGLNYGFERILHGEQQLELTRPLAPSATLTHRARVKDIYDKGKNAVVIIEVKSFDRDGQQVMRNEVTTVVRGAGGWGGDRGPATEQQAPPDRAPDATITEKIADNQALLYRLTGDINPLHADPAFAANFGFKRPILHGLCTFGFAARHIIKSFAGNDSRFLRAIRGRFAESVFPGETLQTEMWKEPDGRIVFRCKVVERGAIVLNGGAAELFKELPSNKPAPAPVAAAPAPAASAAAPEATTRTAFLVLQAHVELHPELVGKVATVFQFKLTNPQSAWTIDLKNGAGAVREGVDEKADVTLEIEDSDFLAMSAGKADPQKLYFGGKLKITGNVMASQKLSFMQKMDRDAALKAAIAAGKFGGASGGATTPAAAPKATAEAKAPGAAKAAKAPALFQGIAERLGKNPGLAAELGGLVQFILKGTDGAWLVDGASGAVREGTDAKATTRIELGEAELEALVGGQATAQDLYQRGQLKVSGDLGPARKLTVLRA
jgi:3-hydroxyacyl-CoA dehydrogenase/3a,7a,12a-trihydroxy-5b-cholest-24-enoyl-CoA hydratase